ncbi:MAG TPA: valine--tRNA ligase [Nitrososphaeraceae archaeon]|nr:valine--tRNA ligase [Nitrososphaeraceae archaeon]
MDPAINTKSWNHEIESQILETWDSQDLYSFKLNHQSKDDNDSTNFFVIDTPPPYPSGKPWHIGAAAHYAQIDMIARTARMNGFNVLFPIGIDRNGLPVEIYTEKKYKVRMRKMSRDKFLELCKSALDELENDMITIMKNLGLSGNFKNYYRTDSIPFRTLTQKTFIDLWNKGLIYISNRPNNYCIDCGTTIADAEIIYEDLPTSLVYMNFTVVDNNNIDKKIIVASTRPELLFACQAIIINPKDQNHSHLVGKEAIIPLFGRKIPILIHHSAKLEFGSGVVMVCSYGDHNDVQVFRELNLKEIHSIDENGYTTSLAGKYKNLKLNQAREMIIDDLKNQGFVEKEEKIMHRTPICERSKTPVEIISLQDYYLRQLEYIPILEKFAEKMRFFPSFHKQILENWLKAVSIDWPISRRRFYGTEIPIWFCKNCNSPIVPEPGEYYKPWKDKPPFDNCKKCGFHEFIGEEKIFDTWMDSSITPLYISQFSNNKEFFSKTYPATIRPQAKDIIRTWLYYTMLRCYQLTDQLPWPNVWIMGYGVDEKGKKMSKSKGNVIDPFPIIQKYGADTFRFWSASETSLGQDFRCSEQNIANSQRFLSKLWNLGRFLSSFEVPKEFLNKTRIDLLHTDKWILSELDKLIDTCLKGYDNYNFFIPATSIRDFTWNLFASHYVEMIKARVYDNQKKNYQISCLYTLHRCFSIILLLLAPICPFITEKLWNMLYSKESIHIQHFPKSVNTFKEFERYTEKIIEFNSFVWNKKKETINPKTGRQLSLKDAISIDVPLELDDFKLDLIAMHNLS